MLAKTSIKGYRSYWIEFEDERYRDILENINNVSCDLPKIGIKEVVTHIRKSMKKSELWYVSYLSHELNLVIKFPIILSPDEASEYFVYAFVEDPELYFNRIGELPMQTYYEVYDDFVIKKFVDNQFKHTKTTKIYDMERFKC